MTVLRRLLADAVMVGAVLVAAPVAAQSVVAPTSAVAGRGIWNDEPAGLVAASASGVAGGSFSAPRPGTVDELSTAGVHYVHVEPSSCPASAGKRPAACASARAASRPATLPEVGTWAMMILGFGVVGLGLRRQFLRFEARFDAKIKRIEAGEPTA